MAIKAIPGADEALSNFPNLPDEAGVRPRIAKALLGCSDVTIWRMAKTGILKAIKVTPRVTVITVGSIRAVLNGGA